MLNHYLTDSDEAIRGHSMSKAVIESIKIYLDIDFISVHLQFVCHVSQKTATVKTADIFAET